ncbi:hypothetical protein SUGI_0512920 [Cryptomeria japonica]|nr:hypothetical protein SUGI_0512920 [Cryptomeria japonica]
MEMENFNRSRAKKNQNLAFWLFVTDNLTWPKTYDLGKFMREEGNDWGLGKGELWIPNDMRLIKEIVAREAHVGCDQDYPVISQATATQSLYENISGSSKSQTVCDSLRLAQLGGR